ncbi:PstS family phosphate ABC transporter substrate-binding protein [Sebaldella sp. S0638]|uniref:PstS family phosphate ABC transporter substrate-binding protein n=1 Tax=Sebaldella sp. S0638 TaxID=2957809 RepID=UPI0020A145E6|nr:substrate-binding domain-containing protein [Sebaldella sp. S0638]MCP1223486.1 substrate-binding domain-containing protein [Sebaldella sp. S0638]
MKKAKLFFLLLMTTGIVTFSAAKSVMLKPDYDVERVVGEIDLWEYTPFAPDNLLYKFEKAPSISISEDYPKLDGATAGYPIYGSIVQAVYKGLDSGTIWEYVQCNTTPYAYNRLINKEVDAIFVLEPSEKQLEAAKKAGVELEMIPIGKEAFIFFVNKENKANNLSVKQIQDIYTKKITNWNKAGGGSLKIQAFQRPENSGSQTIMENRVMKGLKMAEPMKEEFFMGMGGIIRGVADYRNYEGSIGYSFRYYTTGMNKNNNIKILSIDNVEPTVENIKSGKYPYTVNFYLVTRKDVKNKNLDMLIKWILSDEGQKVVEKTGYVPVK